MSRDYIPQSGPEWFDLLASIDDPNKAVRLEIVARNYARQSSESSGRQFLEDLLDRSASADFELQAFLFFAADERRRQA